MLVEGRYLGAAQEQATRENTNRVPLLFMHSIAAGSLDAEGLTLLYESPDVRAPYPPPFNFSSRARLAALAAEDALSACSCGSAALMCVGMACSSAVKLFGH